jgi:hypothetical protein
VEEKDWITFPILGDADLRDRAVARLRELGWGIDGVERYCLDNGISLPWKFSRTDKYPAWHGPRQLTERLVEAGGDERHVIGDFDLLFNTDCYQFGAIDLTPQETSPGGRVVVRSVPLF